MPRGNPTHQLRVLLIKDGFDELDSIIRPLDTVVEYDLRDDLPFPAALFVREPLHRQPKWLRLIGDAVVTPTKKIMNANSSAVLLIRADDRWFAFTFGFGRTLLVPESWERDFGLMVTLNAVDPDSLQTVDAHSFEDLTLHTTRQASRTSPFATFGLNPSHDILRAVTGTPKDVEFAKRVGGSDGLALSTPVLFRDLAQKCRQMLAAYHDTAYRERFAFVDRLRVVNDPALLAALDALLAQAVGAGGDTTLHMAPPEVLDWNAIDGFSYAGPDRDDLSLNVELDRYREALDIHEHLTVDAIKKSRVWAHYVDGAQGHERWSAYDCMVFETEYEGRAFVLTDGKWFEVDADFATSVNRRAVELADGALDLPASRPTDSEDQYVTRTADESGWCRIHGKCSRTVETPIEFCDMFTPDRHLVHVKNYSKGSSTLSHLFLQGTASAECLISDEIFRQDARERVRTAAPDGNDLVGGERPIPGDYTVVYAIIYRPDRAFPQSLPLLSKLSLINCADRLVRTGFDVSLARIR